jgi:hypothetical protein
VNRNAKVIAIDTIATTEVVAIASVTTPNRSCNNFKSVAIGGFCVATKT